MLVLFYLPILLTILYLAVTIERYRYELLPLQDNQQICDRTLVIACMQQNRRWRILPKQVLSLVAWAFPVASTPRRWRGESSHFRLRQADGGPFRGQSSISWGTTDAWPCRPPFLVLLLKSLRTNISLAIASQSFLSHYTVTRCRTLVSPFW